MTINTISTRVAISPAQCLAGKGRLGGRRGTVTARDGNMLTIEFDKVGRERKPRVQAVYAGWVVELTAEVEEALAAWEGHRGAPAGLDAPTA